MKTRKLRKPVREGVAFLIESELEKASLVLAAKSIPEKVQTIAEDLAKIEGSDLMPMMDQLKTLLGPQAADAFSQVVSTSVRELLDAARKAKDEIDAGIANLEAVANGEPPVDPVADGVPPAPDGDAPLGDPATDAPAATGTEGGADASPEMPADDAGLDEPDVGSAGRMRKENAAFRTTAAIRALRESKNPDAVILGTFRRLLEKRIKVAEAVSRVARAYQIDPQDVIAVIREAKAAKRPFDRPGAKIAETKRRLAYRAKWNPDTHWFDIVDMGDKVVAASVTANDDRAKSLAANYKPGQVIESESPAASRGKARDEKWIASTLKTAGVSATVENGVVLVADAKDVARAKKALKANPAVPSLPVRVREKAVTEGVPPPPTAQNKPQQPQQPNQPKQPVTSSANGAPTNGQPANGQPVPVSNTPLSMPGTPVTTPPASPAVPNGVPPVPGGQATMANGQPAPAGQPASNGQPVVQNGKPVVQNGQPVKETKLLAKYTSTIKPKTKR